MRLAVVVLVISAGAWGQDKPSCTGKDIGQPYWDKNEKITPLWVCTPDGWKNVHPAISGPQVTAAPGVDLVVQKNGDVIAQRTLNHEDVIENGVKHTVYWEAGSAPLKCSKWEHVEQKDNYVWCPKYPNVCNEGPKPVCVNDMHEVTEREWQELMERLKKLEKESVKRSDVTAIYGVKSGASH